MKTLTVALLTIIWCSTASATTILYTVSNVDGTTWRYDYSVTNDTLGIDIEGFTIYFDYTLYDNLQAITATPAGWDPIEIQPDIGLPDDGFYDAISLGPGIAPGATLGEFSVLFDYLGPGTPGAQPFEIYDPVTFSLLDQGQTTLVPAPAALWCLLSALTLLGSRYRRA